MQKKKWDRKHPKKKINNHNPILEIIHCNNTKIGYFYENSAKKEAAPFYSFDYSNGSSSMWKTGVCHGLSIRKIFGSCKGTTSEGT